MKMKMKMQNENSDEIYFALKIVNCQKWHYKLIEVKT